MSGTRDRSIAGVTLDVGGVLTLPPILEVLARHGIRLTAEELLVAHHKGVATEDRLLAADPRAADGPGDARLARNQDVATACGATGATRAAVIDALAEVEARGAPWSVLVPGAVDVVDALSEVGLAVAIVSNSDGSVADQLAALDVCHTAPGAARRVAAVVDSGVVGVRKPDPAIFEHALAALGTHAAATAHVGDTVSFDVLAAERAGIVPVHFDASRTCDGAHAHVATLRELPGLLVGL